MNVNNFLSYCMHNIVKSPQEVKLSCVGMNGLRVVLDKCDGVHTQTFITNYPKTLAEFAEYIAKNNMGNWEIFSLDSYAERHLVYPNAIRIWTDWVVLA